jgi:hypothetical protein
MTHGFYRPATYNVVPGGPGRPSDADRVVHAGGWDPASWPSAVLRRPGRSTGPRWKACATTPTTFRTSASSEGGLIYALTAALFGEITVDQGRVQQTNFHTDPMLRINKTPLTEVHILGVGRGAGWSGRARGAHGGPRHLQRHLRRHRQAGAATPDPARRSEESLILSG